MTTESTPTQLAPDQLAGWINDRVDQTLMGHLDIRAVEVGPERAVAHLEVDSRGFG